MNLGKIFFTVSVELTNILFFKQTFNELPLFKSAKDRVNICCTGISSLCFPVRWFFTRRKRYDDGIRERPLNKRMNFYITNQILIFTLFRLLSSPTLWNSMETFQNYEKVEETFSAFRKHEYFIIAHFRERNWGRNNFHGADFVLGCPWSDLKNYFIKKIILIAQIVNLLTDSVTVDARRGVYRRSKWRETVR